MIKLCVQQILYRRGYEWRRDEELFRVIAPLTLKDNLKSKRTWQLGKKATRTVFKAKYYEKFNVFYCQHFAFSIDVKDFGDNWYLCINPTWTVSINGKKKSLVAHKTAKALKRLERNKSVFNHLRFVVHQLTFTDLYTHAYDFLQFRDLETESTSKVIDDIRWLKKESQEEAELSQDIEERLEDPNENLLF